MDRLMITLLVNITSDMMKEIPSDPVAPRFNMSDLCSISCGDHNINNATLIEIEIGHYSSKKSII